MKKSKIIIPSLILMGTMLAGCNAESFMNFVDTITDPANISHQTTEGEGEGQGQGEGQTEEEKFVQEIVLPDSVKNGISLQVGGSTRVDYNVLPDTAVNKEVEITSSNEGVAKYENGKVKAYGAGTCSINFVALDGHGATASIAVTVTGGGSTGEEEVKVTSISVNPSNVTLTEGESKNVTVTVRPSTATNKNYNASSNNSSVATFENGKVVAKAAGSAKITLTAADGSGVTVTINVTVNAAPVAGDNAKYTVLIYMCGSNLESDYANQTSIYDEYTHQYYEHDGIGLAVSDIMEILSVPNQPNDVNIVIQTGGSTKWTTRTYANYGSENISSSYNQRWHVSNGKIVKDWESTKYASMGEADTLKSFLTYGLTSYPAEKTALILWNHGGALGGVCNDDKSGDVLYAEEVSEAVSGALSAKGMAGQKLEWVGYDACLMGLQDVALVNAQYFNYMIASEELENGYGWDYETWVDDLYAHKGTETILTAAVDGFVASYDHTEEEIQEYYDYYGVYPEEDNDQTLAFYDLSYAEEYTTAWENMANQIKSKVSGNKSSFNSLMKTVKHFAGDQYTAYGTFDARDFITKLTASSTFKPSTSYTKAVTDAMDKFVVHYARGGAAGNAYGLALYWSKYYLEEYGSCGTPLENWYYLVNNYCTVDYSGGWY